MLKSRKFICYALILLLCCVVIGCRQGIDTERDTGGTTGEEEPGDNSGAGSGEVNDEDEEAEAAPEQAIRLKATADQLALRKTPGTKDKPADDVLVRLNQGDELFLLNSHDNESEKDGFIWWEVKAGAQAGWVAAKYLVMVDFADGGLIEGHITYPAGNIPEDFTVAAEHRVTGQSYITQEKISDAKYHFGVGFKLNVPPGSYFVYASCSDVPDYRAYYDEYTANMFEIDSYDSTAAYAPIPVTVTPGVHIDDVLVGNWWKQQ